MCVYIYNLFIHSPVNENLACFQILAILNEVDINICTSIYINTFSFFLVNCRSGIAGSQDICSTSQKNTKCFHELIV